MKSIMKLSLSTALIVMLCAGKALGGEELILEQKGKSFVFKGAKVETLKIKVGDVIQFKNMDPYFHNVFSLSDVKLFDLGSYPQGQSKSVKFDKPGKVEIECAIHPEMHIVVEVRP